MIRCRRPALLAAAVLNLLASPAAAQSLDQAELAELEGLLRDLGFDPGTVDGVVDADTTAAIQGYHDFALLPGPPEPTARLLDELRGVAAAYSALNADKGQAPGALPEPAPLPAEPELAEPAPPPDDAPPSEKAVVAPPAPPSKLTAEAAPEVPVDTEEESPSALAETIEEAVAAIAEETVREPAETVEPPTAAPAPTEEVTATETESPTAPETIAELPPEAVQVPADEAAPPAEPSPPEVTAALPPTADEAPLQEAPPAEAPAAAALTAPPTETDEALQASVEAALEPFRPQLADGSLTREDLARRFNKEGRDLLQQADYDAAILKFSVAIRLDPGFAGAYSNRGTAYRLQDDADRAEADLAKAKELGFGGFRLKDAKNPLQ